MITPQPTPEQLDRAMKKFMARAAKRVAKIPLEDRVFLTREEAEEVLRRRAEKQKNQR